MWTLPEVFCILVFINKQTNKQIQKASLPSIFPSSFLVVVCFHQHLLHSPFLASLSFLISYVLKSPGPKPWTSPIKSGWLDPVPSKCGNHPNPTCSPKLLLGLIHVDSSALSTTELGCLVSLHSALSESCASPSVLQLHRWDHPNLQLYLTSLNLLHPAPCLSWPHSFSSSFKKLPNMTACHL